MAQTTDFQSEQFMNLLTDALRAGPGSPEWHQAVTALRSAGAAGADEYQLLIQARENLESGREYREVRAGPAFSRKVLGSIEEEAAGPRPKGPGPAGLIALIAGGVILAVVLVVAVTLFRSAPDPGKGTETNLRSLIFNTRALSVNFDSGAEPGPEVKILGEVPLKVGRDGVLRPLTTQPSNDNAPYRAGALVMAESAAPAQPIAVDVTFRLSRAGDAVIPQVFVAEGEVDRDKGTSPRELLWLLKGGQAQVLLANGRAPSAGEKIAGGKFPQDVTVKIILNKDQALVSVGDARLYEGPHQLASDKPRYIGVRFLRKTGDNADSAALVKWSVFKP